jgi:GNAT superfamily N-acetyltransferase
MSTALRVQRFSGRDIEKYAPDLASLRIRVFRDFPYLYDGSKEYEKKYLQTYVNSSKSVIVIVFDGDLIVGASTGIPLEHETPEAKKPFIENSYDINRVFYCGESVLLPDYRGRGLGVRFFEEREAHARALGRPEYICFCAVQRPDDHPRRPADYVPLDRFWEKRGYRKHPELRTAFTWRDLDETESSAKEMVFWMKILETAR